MSVTNPTQQMNLFSHLYAMMNGELLGNAPKNLEELLCFLLPPVCANTKTDLAQLQLLIAALRGLDHTAAARVDRLLSTPIVNGLTLDMLLSRAAEGEAHRDQFLLMVNQLPQNAQQRAVLLFARAMMGICQQFVTEYQRLQESERARAAQLSLEQRHTRMLDAITVRQLSGESVIWENMRVNPDRDSPAATPAAALLLSQRRPMRPSASAQPIAEPTDCQLPNTHFNYIAHDHQLAGIAGIIPRNENERGRLNRALFNGDCGAVHVISTAGQDDEIERIFYPEDPSLSAYFEPGVDVVVRSIRRLPPAECTAFTEDLGVNPIRRHEYEVIMTTGREDRAYRVLQTFVDGRDDEGFWENHAALRRDFLTASQRQGSNQPLLTLSRWASYEPEDRSDELSDFLHVTIPPADSGEP
ncbi:MAG: hypothetical protein ACRC9R_05875, partial [Enterovibrio sp.]